jgi:branched-chain amino acid transport system substrate-binding protein
MKKIKVISLLVCVILCMFGCTETSQKINVLVNLPLTGDGAPYGKLLKDGIEIGIQQMDENTRNKINVIYQDDKMSAKEEVNILHQEMAKHTISVVMTTSTEFAITLGKICNDNNIVLLPPIADGDQITSGKEYVYLITPTSAFQGSVLAKKIKENNCSTVAVFSLNDSWGKALSSEFQKKFVDEGGKVLISETCEAGQTDMRSVLLKIKNKKPDAILLILHPTETVPALKQIKELGIIAKLYGGDTFSNKDLYKNEVIDLMQGLQFTLPTQPDNAIFDGFKKLFFEQYAYNPDVNAAAARDAILLVAKAVADGAIDGPSIKDKFNSYTNGIEGATGLIKWDENRNVVSKGYSLYIVSGKEYHEVD